MQHSLGRQGQNQNQQQQGNNLIGAVYPTPAMQGLANNAQMPNQMGNASNWVAPGRVGNYNITDSYNYPY